MACAKAREGEKVCKVQELSTGETPSEIAGDVLVRDYTDCNVGMLPKGSQSSDWPHTLYFGEEMKRSQMVRKLVKLLKTWENSKLESKVAKEILDLVESEGMFKCEKRDLGIGMLWTPEGWEPEKKK